MTARRCLGATMLGAAILALLHPPVPAQDLASWTPPYEMRDRGSRDRPALAAKGNTLCMAWRGVLEDNIWVSSTREAWTSQRMLNLTTRNSPVLGTVGDRFLLMWRGIDNDNFWYVTSADGQNWSAPQGLRDRGSRDAPALAGAGDRAVLAWRGVFEDSIWVSTSADGQTWSAQQELDGFDTTGTPALAAASGPDRKFVLAFRGTDQGRLRVSSSADGVTWTEPRNLADATTTSTPAISYSAALKLWYLAWRADDQGTIRVSSSQDGVTWTAPQAIRVAASPGGASWTSPAGPNAIRSQDGPALASRADTLTLIGRENDQNTLWSSSLVAGGGAGDLLVRDNAKEIAGAWTPPMLPKGQENDWMQAVHVAVLPNGKLLIANGSSNRNRLDQNGQFQEGVVTTDYASINNTSLFDPEALSFQRIDSPSATREVEGEEQANDLFCGHQVHLWNGNVLFISGTSSYYPNGDFRGNQIANVYDWKAGEWRDGGVMRDGHWYPTLLPLADGRIVVFSGFTLTENRNSRYVEFYNPFQPADEAWSNLSIARVQNSPFFTRVGGGDDRYDDMDLYPRILPLPDGRFFFTGHGSGAGAMNSRHSYYITIPEMEEGSSPQIAFAPGPDRPEGKRTYAAVINDPTAPAEILAIAGQRGSDNINHGPNAQGVWGAEVTPMLERFRQGQGNNGTWETVYNFLGDGQTDVRIMHDAIVLPTKQVLVIGGGNYSYYRPALRPVLMTRDPQAPGGYRTQVMNPSVIARLYHTSSVLLPDGRVLLAGGNSRRATRDSRTGVVYRDQYPPGTPPEPPVPSESWELEIFSPPYLFLPGPRPSITQAPKTLKYGEAANVTVADATPGGSLVLIRLPSTTHGMDLGQQLVDLPITATDGGRVSFTAPARSNFATPGYYMLFYVNAAGKPSKAAMVQLGADENGLLTAATDPKKE